MKKEMLINVLQPEECRIAILEDGVLEELYVERTSHESYVGNIYKGRIVNIEPSIQAAFVDFGVGRNGFLHVSDVEPTYYRHLEQGRGNGRDRDRGERGGRRGNGRDRGRDRERERDRERPRLPGQYFGEELLPAPPAEPQPVAEELTFRTTVEESLPEPPLVETVAEDLPETREVLPAPPAPEEPTAAAPMVTPEAAPAAEEPTPAAAPEPTSEEAKPDLGPLLVANPETFLSEEPSKGKRRSRGSSSRRKRPSKEETAETPEAVAEETPEPEAGEEPPKPKLMDSAERRTTERDEGPLSSPEVSPVPYGPSAGHDNDDLLFFPPSEPVAPPPAPEPMEPEPVAEETSPPAPAPEPTVPEPWVPPARPRPPRGGSIEDDLEADLAAAEIGAEVPVAPLEDTFTREYEESYEADFGDEIAPPRPREERRGGRDDRRGRRGSGRRMGGRPGMGRPKPLIQDIFRRGQEVIVQVIKEGIGTKGPTLSTYISIAGRYLVLMPGLGRTGVSRKIADEEQRRKLRDMFNELKPPRGLGFIMRTAAVDRQKKELQRDLAYLARLWKVVVGRIKRLKAPAEIYQESDMITRTIRDTFTGDIDSIIIDEPKAFEHAQEFLQIVMPRFASRLKLYEGKEPLFHKYGIEDEIQRIQQKKVPLPNGGSIVIEQTEALVAIDVNSGNFRAADNNAEETAFQINLQAAKEIARQLRLRDLGGVIVNDFIDMRDEKHRRSVEKAMRDAVKRDRARTKILKISAFGLIEMTRQRIRPSLKRSVYQDCPYCHGMAQVKTCESMSIEVMRMIQLAAHREHIHRIAVRVAQDVADYLLNKKRRDISRLEETGNISVQITGVLAAPPELLEFVCYDNNNNEVKYLPDEPVSRRR
jgi:ribonuclease E